MRTVEVRGSTAYIGGSFSSVTGSNGTFQRANVAAFDIPTQRVLTAFRSDTDDQVFALRASASTLYVGGDFRALNGSTARRRLAAVDLATGALQAGLTSGVPSGRVRTIELAGGRLWIGGGFDFVSGQPRSALAALNPANGAVLPIVADADRTVRSLKASADGSSVIVGGDFTTLANQSRPYLGALASDSGVLRPVRFDGLSVPGDNIVFSVATDPSRNLVYGGVGGVKGVGVGNMVVAWNLQTGARVWSQLTDGDVQAVAVYDETVYFGFHEGFNGDTSVRLLAANALTGALENLFRPTMNSFMGVWALHASPAGLVAGGEFTIVSGQNIRRVAVFPVSSAVGVALLNRSTAWRYRDVSQTAQVGWNSQAFDDSMWLSGRPEFGYGDGDETTVVRWGPSTTNKYITTYFRTSIDIADPSRLSDVYLNLVADDGAVVYLNGSEVVRDNMPSGTISGSTLAATARDGAFESAVRSFPVSTNRLVPGPNVIAVEVHQAKIGRAHV